MTHYRFLLAFQILRSLTAQPNSQPSEPLIGTMSSTVEGNTWRFSLTNCRRFGAEVGCFIAVTNLTNATKHLYLKWYPNVGDGMKPPDESGVSTVRTSSDLYLINRLYSHGDKEEAVNPSSKRVEFYTVTKHGTIQFNIYLTLIPKAITTFDSIELAVGTVEPNTNHIAKFTTHFNGVPIFADQTSVWATLNTPLVKTLLLLLYLGLCGLVFFRHLNNSAFVYGAFAYCAVATIALTVLQYGSPYHLSWDYSRWHWGDDFGLFPIRVSNSPVESVIPKSSVTYWILTMLGTAIYVTFPQAVLNAAGIHLVGNRLTYRILRTVASLWGLGLGFVAIILTFTSLVSPYPSTNWLLMLGACLFIIAMMGSDILVDMREGTEKFIPGGGEVVRSVRFLSGFIRLWRR